VSFGTKAPTLKRPVLPFPLHLHHALPGPGPARGRRRAGTPPPRQSLPGERAAAGARGPLRLGILRVPHVPATLPAEPPRGPHGLRAKGPTRLWSLYNSWGCIAEPVGAGLAAAWLALGALLPAMRTRWALQGAAGARGWSEALVSGEGYVGPPGRRAKAEVRGNEGSGLALREAKRGAGWNRPAATLAVVEARADGAQLAVHLAGRRAQDEAADGVARDLGCGRERGRRREGGVREGGVKAGGRRCKACAPGPLEWVRGPTHAGG
jgi:hypothetical protein